MIGGGVWYEVRRPVLSVTIEISNCSSIMTDGNKVQQEPGAGWGAPYPT